jgi:DNA-binding transcriptional LysR family regulator
MELTVGLSEDLYAAFDAGDLDIIFVKRRVGDPRGVSAWREPLAWIGRPNYWLDPDTPVPLLVYPPPSVTRARAFATLDAARRSWRIAFTSGSLSALSAAARAGLGLMPHSARLMPPGLAAIAPGPGLPRLPEVEFAIIGPGGRDPVAEALTGVILQWAAYGSTAGRS